MAITTNEGRGHDPEKGVDVDDERQRNLRTWPTPRDNEISATAEEEEAIEESEQHEKPSENCDAPAISRILSRRSAASFDPGPAPDGGTTAWIQVLCTHLTIFTTFGFFTSFGVYQTYYVNTLGIAPSTISWIGSIQVFLLFGIGTFTGRATDAGLFRPVYIAGAVFQIVGVFTMAESTKLWQLFLTQGVCLGIANGLQFCPSMALVSTYFVKKRAFALGITALGSCTGGVVFPIIVQQCLPRFGFPWTIRIIGFIMVVLNIVTIVLYRTRLPPRKTGPLVDWESFKEAPFALYCAGMFFAFWGLYFAFFYIGSYARNVLGATYQQSINLLLVQVCMGFVFRLLPTYYADKIGGLNVLIPFAFISGIMMFGWIGIHSIGALYAFAVIYGSASAVLQALWPALNHSTRFEMLLLNTVLQILDIFSAMLKLFGALATLLDICCQNALKRCIQADTPPTEDPSPNVLFTPLSALHGLIYDTIRPQLTHLSSEEQLTLLRGRRFASLADAIIENTPSPIIKKLGLRLPPREKIEELKGLPALIVTAPEDGDRAPLRGEKGGKKVRYAKGFLSPPSKRKRKGKLAREAKKKLANLMAGGQSRDQGGHEGGQ
ncbi:hypothetical protein N0V83_005284 [Neocucurbitaria cava]|uniref:Uncharacterized protein n=1 Tax=Neocucurbitaria cava TaxID=798079 RepID=A0A9W8Y8U5_9PLEO|nr:hypothetical protein N0V83_005284 [Neocucurbitaria cava]